MPERLEDLFRNQPPTADRPLQGQTILVIEDSRFASEAMRLLCIRSGARVRRADSLRTAARHLATYRPSVVIVDLGLPDGNGCGLIRALVEAKPRIGAVLATSGNDALEDEARAAGADGFLPKPLTSLALFQKAVLSVLPDAARPVGPRPLHRDDRIVPDRIALRDDLAHVADILRRDVEPATLGYLAQFLHGVARVAQDADLERAALELAAACETGEVSPMELDRIVFSVDARLDTRESV